MMSVKYHNCCTISGDLFSALPLILWIEFILGVLGNGMALWIFCFCFKPWKSSTVFLVNLALADFLLNVILPFRASYYRRGRDWLFGDTLCRISLFMLAMNRCGSILFLTVVTVDRFLRVVHPHHPFNSMSVRRTVGVACAIWALTISQAIHLIFYMDVTLDGNSTLCESFQVCETPTFYFIWHKFIFVFSFYLPLAIILFCSMRIITQLKNRQLDRSQRIRKTLRLITMVVVIFFLCFFPSNMTHLVIWIKGNLYSTCEEYRILQAIFFYSISLTYLNSMLDPIVYYFYSPTFKTICKKWLKQLWQKEGRATEEDQTRETGSQTLTQL